MPLIRLPLVAALGFVTLVACSSPSDGGSVPTECEPSNTVSLDVGESASFTSGAARFFCAGAAGDDADFVLTTFAATTSDLEFSVRTGNTVVTQGPPSPVAAGPRATELFPGPSASGNPTIDYRFHQELRERERRELSPLVLRRGPGFQGAPDDRAAAAIDAPATVVPDVGDFLTFNTQSFEACSNPITITARVWAVSQRAIVAADVGNPTGGFGAGDYLRFAATFDTLLAPIADQNFGVVTDIDSNQRTILLYTQEVNRRTPAGSATLTAGFFFSRDLFPKQTSPDGQLAGCATSNVAELLYLLVPDPTGQVNGNARTKDFVERLTIATIMHEDQHLVNAARRLHVQELGGSNWNEDPWLNEGLSHAAEELLFYRASGFAPGQNISSSSLNAGGNKAIVAFNDHQAFNLQRLFDHLAAAPESSPFNPVDALTTRGATWSFLRYAADRRGGNQTEFIHSLVNSSVRGMANLSTVLGGEPTVLEWMTDWGVALYADDRVTGLESRHQTSSWNYPSVHSSLESTGSLYPVETVTLLAGFAREQELIGGGTAYFRLGVAEGQDGEIEITSGGGTPPPTLRVTLLRTR